MWCARILLKHLCVWGDLVSIDLKLKLLKQSLLVLFSQPCPFIPWPPPKPHTYLITFFLFWQLPPTCSHSSLLLFSNSISHLLSLLLPTPTHSHGCFLTRCKLLSTPSPASVLSIYLSFVAWARHRPVTRDRFPQSGDSESEHLSYYFCDRVALPVSEQTSLACLFTVSHGVPTPKTAAEHKLQTTTTVSAWRWSVSWYFFNFFFFFLQLNQHDWVKNSKIFYASSAKQRIKVKRLSKSSADSGTLD